MFLAQVFNLTTQWLLYIFVFIASWLFYILLRNYFRMKNNPLLNIPSANDTSFWRLCIFGSKEIPEVARSKSGMIGFTEHIMATGHKLFLRFRWFGTPYVLCHDVDTIQYMLKGGGQKNWKKGDFSGTAGFRFLLGNTSMILNDGEIHKNHRKVGSAAFKGALLERYVGEVNLSVDRLIECWNKKIDRSTNGQALLAIHDDLSHVTLDIIIRICLSLDIEALEKKTFFSEVFDTLVRGNEFDGNRLWRMPLFMFLPSPGHINFFIMLRKLHKKLDNIIKDRIRNAETQIPAQTDYLSMLLEGYITELMGLKEVRHELMTFLIAGHETSATALMWTLLLLAQHKEIQEKVRSEVKAIDGRPSPSSLPYTNAVVHEAMRLFPPIPAITRSNVEQDEILGYQIPENTNFYLNMAAIHRDADYWSDPKLFNPDRFLDTDAVPWNAFLPFGDGVHKCLGYAFALQEITLITANLVKKFLLTEDSTQRIRAECLVTLSPYPTPKIYIERCHQ